MPVKLKPRPRSLTYPLVGAALSLGAPSGLLLLRWAMAGAPMTGHWWLEELRSSVITYAYLMASTTLAFVVFGAILGRAADRLLETSRRDPLTALSNRRHFREQLELELGRVRRYGSPLSLLMLDVDGLKTINDEGGHEAGDAALKEVARALSAHSRSTDIAARWGGDEFVLLAPGIEAHAAHRLAERIRAEIRRRSRPRGRLGASIGVADCKQLEELTEEALTAAADTALYLAKSRGRDRSVVFQPRTQRAPPRARASPVIDVPSDATGS